MNHCPASPQSKLETCVCHVTTRVQALPLKDSRRPSPSPALGGLSHPGPGQPLQIPCGCYENPLHRVPLVLSQAVTMPVCAPWCQSPTPTPGLAGPSPTEGWEGGGFSPGPCKWPCLVAPTQRCGLQPTIFLPSERALAQPSPWGYGGSSQFSSLIRSLGPNRGLHLGGPWQTWGSLCRPPHPGPPETL